MHDLSGIPFDRTGLSRRDFVRTIACGSAAGLASRLPGEVPGANKEETLKFLIVSDTHLGRNGLSAEKLWSRAAAELQAAEGEFVLHLGDVINAGLVDQYEIYTRIRDTIGKPVHEIPGNHDPADAFEQHLQKSADRSFDCRGVRFILFNNSHRDSHDGFMTEAQLDWLGSQLSEARAMELRVIIGAHVPFHTNRNPDRGWYVKPADGQTAFYDMLDRHRGRVLALLHGHFHNGVRGWDDRHPLHEVLLPSIAYNQNRGLTARQAPGYNLDEFRSGYVEAHLTSAQLALRYRVIGVPEASQVKELPLDASIENAASRQPG